MLALLAFLFQQMSKSWGGEVGEPVGLSKIIQSISLNDDLQQKLSQNSLETTSEITPL